MNRMTITPHAPRILGIGGTTSEGSGTERALQAALQAAQKLGAEVELFGGAALSELPIFNPRTKPLTASQHALVDAVRAADGIIIATPAYHGSISGAVKNALDTLELTAGDPSPYFAEKPVGTIVTAYGSQACGTTLVALRTIVHALRGWPTPFGAALIAAGGKTGGAATVERDDQALSLVASQVTQFSRMSAAAQRVQ